MATTAPPVPRARWSWGSVRLVEAGFDEQFGEQLVEKFQLHHLDWVPGSRRCAGFRREHRRRRELRRSLVHGFSSTKPFSSLFSPRARCPCSAVRPSRELTLRNRFVQKRGQLPVPEVRCGYVQVQRILALQALEWRRSCSAVRQSLSQSRKGPASMYPSVGRDDVMLERLSQTFAKDVGPQLLFPSSQGRN